MSRFADGTGEAWHEELMRATDDGGEVIERAPVRGMSPFHTPASGCSATARADDDPDPLMRHAAWAAVRELMSAPALAQLRRLFAEGLDYHPYFSTVHPVVWAAHVRMQPSEWQKLCEFVDVHTAHGGTFSW